MSWNNKKSFKIKHENNVVENLRKVGKGRDRNPSKWFPEEQTFEAVLTKFRINLMTYFKFQKIMYSDIFFYLTIETAPVPRYFLPSSKIHIVFWHWPAEPRAIIIVIAPPVGHTFRFHPNLHNPLTTLQLVKGEPESNKRLWRRRPLPINNRPLSLLFFFSLLLLFCWCMIWGVQNLCTPYGIRWIIWWQQQEHQSVILLMWYVSHSRRVVQIDECALCNWNLFLEQHINMVVRWRGWIDRFAWWQSVVLFEVFYFILFGWTISIGDYFWGQIDDND